MLNGLIIIEKVLEKSYKILIILGLFLLIGFLFYKEVYKNDSIDEVNPEKFINKIDSLELIVDSLSIKKEIIENVTREEILDYFSWN